MTAHLFFKATFGIILTILLFVYCSRKITTSRGRPLLKLYDTTIAISGNTQEEIKILYTGCGGLVISAVDQAVIVDPYYTSHNPLLAVAGSITQKPANTNWILSLVDAKMTSTTNVKAVLLSHSHFDHMEDLPWMLHNGLLPAKVSVLGSPTAREILDTLSARITFYNGDTLMHQQGAAASGTWLPLSNSFSVLPIESSHAPHFICGIHLMRCCGATNCRPTVQGIGNSPQTTRGRDWKEGSVYSFLFKIKRGNRIIRLFVQTSASQNPDGFPPPDELARDSIDLAVFCMASFRYVNNYPEAHLEALKPRKAMFIHWENFGKSMYVTEPRSVPLTNPRKFYNKVKTFYRVVHLDQLRSRCLMPKPGVLTTVRF